MNRKISAIIIVLVSVIGLQVVLTFWLYNQRVYFKSAYETILSNYVSIEQDYSILETDYANLTTDYDNLTLAYNDLESNYANLQSDYSNLVSDFNSLSFEYNLLQEDYDFYIDAYEELKESINLRSSHPTEQEKNLITPDDPEVQSVVLSVTGGWSDPDDWNDFWDDYEKLCDWVVDNIEYRYDGYYPILPSDLSGNMQQRSEMWQLPSETLDCRKGDCEDMAILLASLLYSYNDEQYDVHCIVTPEHVGVCFPVMYDRICILDPAINYYTSSGFPFYNLSSDDIEDEVSYWINTYDLDRVEWVFSKTVWQEFSNTEDFINWMIDEY